MSWNGRINVDALIHDEATNAIKVLDVESSYTVGSKSAIVTGTATAEGVSISPDDEHEIAYTDATGAVVTFSSVSLLVIHGTDALTVSVNGGVQFSSAAGQCALSHTPGMTTETINITGAGTFTLLIVGHEMQPGLLRERVELQRAAETRNALGEVTQTWQTYANRYASVLTLRSREALNAQQTGLTVTHKVKLRHVDGLKSSDRILWRGRTLHIVSVLEFEQFTVHELLCEEQA